MDDMGFLGKHITENNALPSVTTLLAWQVQQPLAKEHEAKAEVSLPIDKENLDLLKVVGNIENLSQIVV